jgi:predicted patatin/cPLA2 family phospholipase
MRSDGSGRALAAADARDILRRPGQVSNPVLEVLLERVRSGSRPRMRDDGHVVCLAVEGGGMRGAVSAGMCVVLEAAGLTAAFDRVYGVSAGALNGSALAAGQAALSATHYEDAASRRVINPLRPLLRRPVIDYDVLFGDVIGARKPLSFAALRSGPDFRALAASLDTLSLRVLSGFADADELMQAVRASAALPTLGGPAPAFRGERMVDGGVLEPIPYETALREGATHVLVLRSRPAGFRRAVAADLRDVLLVRHEPRFATLMRERRGTYNRQAADLERVSASDASRVLQIAVPAGTPLIGRLEANQEAVVAALRAGARAIAAELLNEAIDLCWQPTLYRAVDARAAEMRLAPTTYRSSDARGAAASA